MSDHFKAQNHSFMSNHHDQPSLKRREVIFRRGDRGLRLSLNGEPHLYQSAYEHALLRLAEFTGEERQWWSRAKAYVQESITPAMWGLMKVAGKRLYQVTPTEFESIWFELPQSQRREITLSSQTPLIESTEIIPPHHFGSIDDAAQWLESWVDQENLTRRQKGLGEEDSIDRRWSGVHRTVGAIALDQDLTCVAVSLNQPDQDHTAHAERRLLEKLSARVDQGLAGLTRLHLLSSLKPCKMCSGLWVTYPISDALSVYYLRDDLGANGQNTALDRESHAWSAAKRWRCSFRSLSQHKFDDAPLSRNKD